MSIRATLVMLVIVAGSAACGPPATAHPPASIASTPTPPASASPTPCADRALASLSEDQRIGQLFLLGLAANQLGAAERDAIQSDHLGSVWFVDRTSRGVAAIRAVTDAVQQQAASATGGVRFFTAANQEGGITQALQGPGFAEIPSALVQGSLDPATLKSQAQTWGEQLRAAGVNLAFGPVFDVVAPGTDTQNEPIGALQREYGHDPARVGSHAVAVLRGLHQAGVATAIKHFPGLGRVRGNTDFTAATDTVTTATDPYLQPFSQGIGGGTEFVMVALAAYTQIDPGHLAVFSPIVMRDMLRGTLGFQGVVMSDDLGATVAVAAIPPGARAIDFLKAGGDMIISKTAAAARSMVEAIRARVSADPVFKARVDDAARRILTAKQAAGLLSC